MLFRSRELKLEELAQRHYMQLLENRLRSAKDTIPPPAESDAMISEKGFLKAGAEVQAWLKDPEEIDDLREHYMASRLSEMMKEYSNILVVIGLAHWPRVKLLLEQNDVDPDLTAFVPNISAELFNVLPEDFHFITATPNLTFQWEVFRQRQKLAVDDFDEYSRLTYDLIKFDQFFAIKIIIQRSVERYQSIYHEKVNMHKLRSFFQYLRNLPQVYQQFRPELFDIVLAAKGIVNDDFAWVVWDECKLYPYAKDDPKLDAARLTDQGILLHGRFFKLRRHMPLFLKKIKLPLKPKPKESKPGEWRQIWERDSYNLVSHLPEDLFEENYFQHVRQRTMARMKDHFIKIHEFTSTLMDGIDFRETIRNWPIGQKIFVREERPIHGEVDSVVIIFDRDEELPERYPHVMMWYAEHNQESDLAVYSTYPGIELVGPGISRVEIGGVVSFFPPRTVPNIWSASFVKKYPFAQKKADRALTAAIIYCQKKFVTYVAKDRPASRFYALASKLGVSIVYLPLDRFNPVSIRALRNIHMLAGKKVRAYADQYVNKRKY